MKQSSVFRLQKSTAIVIFSSEATKEVSSHRGIRRRYARRSSSFIFLVCVCVCVCLYMRLSAFAYERWSRRRRLIENLSWTEYLGKINRVFRCTPAHIYGTSGAGRPSAAAVTAAAGGDVTRQNNYTSARKFLPH